MVPWGDAREQRLWGCDRGHSELPEKNNLHSLVKTETTTSRIHYWMEDNANTEPSGKMCVCVCVRVGRYVYKS